MWPTAISGLNCVCCWVLFNSYPDCGYVCIISNTHVTGLVEYQSNLILSSSPSFPKTWSIQQHTHQSLVVLAPSYTISNASRVHVLYIHLPTLRTVLLRCPSWGMWDEFLCVFSCSWDWPVVYHTLTQIRKWKNSFCQQFPYPNREKWIASLLYVPLSSSLYFPYFLRFLSPQVFIYRLLSVSCNAMHH